LTDEPSEEATRKLINPDIPKERNHKMNADIVTLEVEEVEDVVAPGILLSD